MPVESGPRRSAIECKASVLPPSDDGLENAADFGRKWPSGRLGGSGETGLAHREAWLGAQSKTRRLVRWQRWSPHLQPSGAVSVVHAGERYRPPGPPPSLQPTTAVLTAARGKSVDQMPPQVADYPRNALQNEGRGVRRLTGGSAAPEVPGGELGSPNGPPACWPCDTDSDRNSSAARSVVTRRSCVLYDSFLPESRSPRRDASADRKWRWPGGVPNREPEVRTAVVDGHIAQFRTETTCPRNDKRSTTQGIINQERGTMQVDREGDVPAMRILEEDSRRRG